MKAITWSVYIKAEGVPEGSVACVVCTHSLCCNITKLGPNMASMLTSVDIGSDGHMASGVAELHCAGFELPAEQDENVDGDPEAAEAVAAAAEVGGETTETPGASSEEPDAA